MRNSRSAPHSTVPATCLEVTMFHQTIPVAWVLVEDWAEESTSESHSVMNAEISIHMFWCTASKGISHRGLSKESVGFSHPTQNDH